MAAPEGSPEFFELGKEFVGSFALEGLHEFADGKKWWHGEKEMHVIPGNRTFDDIDLVALAYLSYELPEPLRYLSVENLLAVLRAPYQMVLDVIDRVRRFSVILHTLMLLKSSPYTAVKSELLLLESCLTTVFSAAGSWNRSRQRSPERR